MSLFDRIGSFLLFNVFFWRLTKRFERQLQEHVDAWDGGDPLQPLEMPFPAEDDADSMRVGRAEVVVRYHSYQIPHLLSVAPQLARGKSFGIEYLALTPQRERERILAELRTQLPYARVEDVGEAERAVLRANKNASARSCRFWNVLISPQAPGYGISDETVEAHTDEFVEAARDFRLLADGLVQRILLQYELEIADLIHTGSFGGVPGGAEHGRSIFGETLDNTWHIEFGSGAWHLTHTQTQQEVRVSLYHGSVGGILHPHGFSRFLRTTPRWQKLSTLLGDDYFDAHRVLWQLHQTKRWEVIPRLKELGLLGTNALAAPLNDVKSASEFLPASRLQDD